MNTASKEKHMECINHPGTAAAGTCQICGKGLCAQCVSRFSPPLCEACLLRHNRGVAVRLSIDLAITAAIIVGVGIVIYFQATTNRWGGFTVGIMLAAAYWGWQFLNRLPTPVFFLSGAGWIFYLLVKLMISVLAGVIIGPWEIFRRIKELHEIRSLEQAVRNGKA